MTTEANVRQRLEDAKLPALEVKERVLSQGMQVASESSNRRRGNTALPIHFKLDLQNCKIIHFCNGRNLVHQHKTQFCSSKDWGTSLSAQEAKDALNQGVSYDLKVGGARAVCTPGPVQTDTAPPKDGAPITLGDEWVQQPDSPFPRTPSACMC